MILAPIPTEALTRLRYETSVCALTLFRVHCRHDLRGHGDAANDVGF